jgi:dinuclear metal center YbgI/SA1388 family protein
MTTVADVTAWLEQFAPARLAEPWDNVGLLLGDPRAAADRVMTCLTVTAASAAEAIAAGAHLIVSHHPVLFREVKKFRADLPETGDLWALARAGIAVASPHTAFDNTHDGINDILCRRLRLVDVTPLRPLPNGERSDANAPASFKVVVFTPEADRDAVSTAAFAAGAGKIGAYQECSFAIPGEGTFFGTDLTNPSVGERGRRMSVREFRLEFVCAGARLAAVLAAVRTRHSYEEPAIDIYPLHDTVVGTDRNTGAGRIGRLVPALTISAFAADVSAALGRVPVGLAGDPRRPIERVAIACGAGDDFLKDVFVTGEARFHRALEAEALGIGLITAGHYATERPGIEVLAQNLAAAFPGLTVWPSRHECDPTRWFKADLA